MQGKAREIFGFLNLIMVLHDNDIFSFSPPEVTIASMEDEKYA